MIFEVILIPGELNIRNLFTKLIAQEMLHFMRENMEGVLVPGGHSGRIHFMLKNVELVLIPGELFILYILKEMNVNMVLVPEVLRHSVM